MENTPQHTIMGQTQFTELPNKLEKGGTNITLKKFGVDVRSLRYPGLIGWKSNPGGGTTDYAVNIFHKAITDGKYESFLLENTFLPMMYMTDAIRATIELMESSFRKS